MKGLGFVFLMILSAGADWGGFYYLRPSPPVVRTFLFSQHEPEKPTVACSPKVQVPKGRKPPAGQRPCECLTSQEGDQGQGCKERIRETETAVCKSYCWKEMCACCVS